MKFLIKKNYIILLLFIIFSIVPATFAKDNTKEYSKETISNYFSGVVSANQDYNNEAFNNLKKVKLLKNKHSNFNLEFVKTLILLEKFNEAFSYVSSLEEVDKSFFEIDLILGLNYFIKKDYKNAEIYFEKLNNVYQNNFLFKDFFGNSLISWSKAIQKDKRQSFKFIKKVPKHYGNLAKIQSALLSCHFKEDDTYFAFQNLVNSKDYNFSRYNFFLVNYLLYEKKNTEAKKILFKSRLKDDSNLLLNQTQQYLLNNEKNKVKRLFNCKNINDSIAEFFYIIANLHASEKNYKLSNFYLKISLFLNKKFETNQALLAENYFYQKKYKASKKIYSSLKSIGSEYSWHSSKVIAKILLEEKGKDFSIGSLKNEFLLLKNPNFQHFYELANFYKENEYYKESIKYYSLALQKIKKNHVLFPKILDRRGASYERIGDWEKGEKDLIESLKILPDQPHVLNYLAYTWIDKGVNIDKGLEMIKKANRLRNGDGYIIDSLGWAYYIKKNYIEAEQYLQKAVELLPEDPIINDHYADNLWMLNKRIQARYFWQHVLNLENTNQELKDKVSKKIIFGTTENL